MPDNVLLCVYFLLGVPTLLIAREGPVMRRTRACALVCVCGVLCVYAQNIIIQCSVSEDLHSHISKAQNNDCTYYVQLVCKTNMTCMNLLLA